MTKIEKKYRLCDLKLCEIQALFFSATMAEKNIVFVRMSFHCLCRDLLEEVNMRYLDKHHKAFFQHYPDLEIIILKFPCGNP